MTDPKQINVITAKKIAYARKASVTTRAGISMSQNRMRYLLILAFALLCAVPTFAQTGTPAPVPRQQFLDNNGAPLASGKLYTYSAGTSTPLSTYTTAALTVANANPLILDSAGRATIFLTSASYKFVLATSADVIIWTVDNVSSVAPFNVDLDVTGTAGEALTAGQVVYLSDGSASLNNGRWYKADADLLYASSHASQIGIVVADIASAASGSIRQAGRVTGLTGLSTGTDYYISGTAGALTGTPPTNGVRIGRTDSSSTLILGTFRTPSGPRGPPCGRLTLTSGTPVTITDVTAATTVYYTPAGSCNTLSLYDGTEWQEDSFAELSIAVPATTVQMYDVFAYDNAGTIALELTAWSSDTARATALVLQNGVYVKTGVTTRRYLGSFRTTGVSGQTEDSFAKRYVWNYYNRAPRLMRVIETTDSWVYTTATWRQARATATNQLDFVVGVAEVELNAQVLALWDNDGGGSHAAVAIAIDSTTVPTTGNIGMHNYSVATGTQTQTSSMLRVFPAVGRHVAVWLEYAITTSGNTTWFGDNASASLYQSGIHGTIWG